MEITLAPQTDTTCPAANIYYTKLLKFQPKLAAPHAETETTPCKMDNTFEDKIGELDELLSRYRAKWQLTVLAWMDYDDVCQIVRLHIYNKWHLWDQKKSFKPWASRVISNQIKNLIRNHYSNFCKPCLRCPHYMGGDSCAFTQNKIQNEECELFAKWRKKKEKAYNIKLPMPIEDQVIGSQFSNDENFDYKRAESRLHKIILDQLIDKHKQVYTMLFIEGASDKEVAERFCFKGDSLKRKETRYKHLANLKKVFYKMAQDAMQEHDIL
jgi:RNA polymerase sigma factor (sigma-70 family)